MGGKPVYEDDGSERVVYRYLECFADIVIRREVLLGK